MPVRVHMDDTGAWQIVKLKLTKLKLTLTLFLTLTDTGGAVLTLTKIIN